MSGSFSRSIGLFALKAAAVVSLWWVLAPSNPRDLLYVSIFTGPSLLFMLALAFASSFESIGAPRVARPLAPTRRRSQEPVAPRLIDAPTAA